MHELPCRTIAAPPPSSTLASRRGALAANTVRCAAWWLVAAAFLTFATVDSGAVPIGDLHQNDANGVPATPYTIGTPVSVTGVVTVPDSVFNLFSTAVHVQDATGGIYVFQSGGVFQYNFDLGDSVTVSGEVGQFAGITEVTHLTSVNVHGQGHPIPAAVELTCNEVENTFDPVSFREENEGRLVLIRDVSITGGVWPTSPGNGTALTISDAGGSTTLYIAKDSDLNGTPAPPAIFDVTGVIQQSDQSAPFTGGYRVMPRYLSDIGSEGPVITAGPEVVELTPTSVRIEWVTSTPSSSTVELGPTTDYGLTFDDPTPVTDHSMLLSPIDDASWWNYRVRSSDGNGTAISPNFTFFTQPATDEALMVFFNKSIDPTYATGKVAAGDVPIAEILVHYIDQAQYSVDAAFYSLSLPGVADALIAAHFRGVEVRVIKEATTSTFQFNRLLSAGIPAVTADFAGPRPGIHHNKFWVIDARDVTSPLDDWVITGSWNPTFQGTEDDAQNIVVLKDSEMAAAYTVEFDEMWGSSTNVPDAGLARFSTDKFNNTQHQFTVNGIPVEMYFAPSDGHENVMLIWINNAHSSIYFSILTFTRDQIQSAMRNRWDTIPGFEVRGVFDKDFDSFSEYPVMSGTGGFNPWSPPADVHLGDYSPGFLHHKYMIIDCGDPTSDPMVITGSPNWTTAARNENDENQIHIHDYDIARVYLQEFAEVYHGAGGSGPLGQTTGLAEPEPAPGARHDFGLSSAPNPFNPRTTIRFELARATAGVALTIYDVEGRAVRTLLDDRFLTAGQYAIEWDGANDAGTAIASGVYYMQLELGDTAVSRSVVLAR